MADDLSEIEVVYLGVRRGAKSGKLLPLFITPELLAVAEKEWHDKDSRAFALTITDHIDGRGSMFDFKDKPAVIGGLYRVRGKLNDDGRINTLSTKSFNEGYVRPLGHELEAVWQATSRGEKVKVDAERVEKKRGENGALDRVLDDLAGIYANVPPQQREAFKLMVLGAMQRRK